MSTYEAWRATHQDAEAAAKAAFEQVQGLAKMVDGLQGALGAQVRFGSEGFLTAIEKLPRYTYGYKSDEWGMGRALTTYASADGKFLLRDEVLAAIASQAQQATPTADMGNTTSQPPSATEAGNPASGAQDKMSTTQQPAALRLADKYEAHGFLGDHRFAKEQWCSQAAVELRRLHAENQDLRTRHYCNTAEIESLQARVQELGEMARENRSKRIVGLEGRIAEMEEQMAAIGAGGVEPLRKTNADTSALRAALEEAEAALEVATSRLSARGANYPVHVTSESRALEIVRHALGKSHADHFRGVTKMMPTTALLDADEIVALERLALANLKQQDEIRTAWNAQADDGDRWHSLSEAEKVEWAAIHAAAKARGPAPIFNSAGWLKLESLQRKGFRVVGYTMEHCNILQDTRRCTVDYNGLVRWVPSAEQEVAKERAARQAAQVEVAELKERIARAGVEQRRAVHEAVLQEREDCAQVAERMARLTAAAMGMEIQDACAAAIRARQ